MESLAIEKSTTNVFMELGVLVDGQAETVVIHDMLGFELFYFDDVARTYRAKPKHLLWNHPISSCTNLDDFSSLMLPGGFGLRQYLDAGYDSFGYVSTLCDYPELAEYLDNPGMLILLIAYLPGVRRVLEEGPTRINLLRQLVSNDQIHRYHINWLKKVCPGSTSPAELANNIAGSLLLVPALHSARRQTNGLFKLFAHQSQWTAQGLSFARMLVHRRELPHDDLYWFLQSFNGNEASIISKVRIGLCDLGNVIGVPPVVAQRAKRIATGRGFLTLEDSRRFKRVILASSDGESGLLEVCRIFISDDDIPSPVVRGNSQVRALDTIQKIRDQARIARNCLWSLDILRKVLYREIDLYAVEGENLYTISVDRRTLDLRMIEAAKATMIKPGDLSVIAEWFEECTRLPR